MSRRDNCWANAVAESFFNSLKKDRIRKCDYKTRELAPMSSTTSRPSASEPDVTAIPAASVPRPLNGPLCETSDYPVAQGEIQQLQRPHHAAGDFFGALGL